MVQTSPFKDGKCVCPICNKLTEEKLVFKSSTKDEKIVIHCEHYRGMGAKENIEVCVWK